MGHGARRELVLREVEPDVVEEAATPGVGDDLVPRRGGEPAEVGLGDRAPSGSRRSTCRWALSRSSSRPSPSKSKHSGNDSTAASSRRSPPSAAQDQTCPCAQSATHTRPSCQRNDSPNVSPSITISMPCRPLRRRELIDGATRRSRRDRCRSRAVGWGRHEQPVPDPRSRGRRRPATRPPRTLGRRAPRGPQRAAAGRGRPRRAPAAGGGRGGLGQDPGAHPPDRVAGVRAGCPPGLDPGDHLHQQGGGRDEGAGRGAGRPAGPGDVGQHLPLGLRPDPAQGDRQARLQVQLLDLRRGRLQAADDDGRQGPRPRPQAPPAQRAAQLDVRPQERAARPGGGDPRRAQRLRGVGARPRTRATRSGCARPTPSTSTT